MRFVDQIRAFMLIAVAIIGNYGCEHQQTPPQIDIVLATATPVIKVDQRPQFSISLINRDKKSVTLVKPGDGSLDRWRTPFISWSGINDDYSLGRCGNINALKKEEVFKIEPGKMVQLDLGWIQASLLAQFPTQLGTFLLQPGTYQVAFNYENVPKLEWTGLPLGRHDWFAMRQVRNSTPFKGTSNTVTITVVDR